MTYFYTSSPVKEKWKKKSDLKLARKDTYISIILGGIVSMSIMISATAFRGNEVKNIMDFAKSTEPLCGSFAKYFLSIGL